MAISRQLLLPDFSYVTDEVTRRALEDVKKTLEGLNRSLYNDLGSPTVLIRVGHSYAIPGEIKVPSGDLDCICPFFVSLAAGQTAKLVKCRYIIGGGTSVTFKIQKNGSDATGFTELSCTTTVGETDPTDITLANNDKIAAVVTAVSGTPKNLSLTLFIEYSIP